MLRSPSSAARASACPAFRPMFFHWLIVHFHCRAVARSVVPPAASFRMPVTSSASRMLNCGLRPSRAPSARNMRTPSAWKVHTSTSLARGPIRPPAPPPTPPPTLLLKMNTAKAPQPLLGAAANQAPGTLAHLGRSLVGEGDGGNAPGFQAALDHVGDLVRDHPGLARTRAGQHQAGPVGVMNRPKLGKIETGRHEGAGRGQEGEPGAGDWRPAPPSAQ